LDIGDSIFKRHPFAGEMKLYERAVWSGFMVKRRID
jgi:hypothetical protein